MIVEVLVYAGTVGGVVAAHVLSMRRLTTRVAACSLAREKAQDKHLKAVSREAQRIAATGEATLATVRHLHEDAALLHARVDRHMADLKRGPNV